MHIRAHSTRPITSSWVWLRGRSIQDICFAADWSSQNTFARFYKLEVSSFASQVISVSDCLIHFMLSLMLANRLLNTVIHCAAPECYCCCCICSVFSVGPYFFHARYANLVYLDVHWLISAHQLRTRMAMSLLVENYSKAFSRYG